jgi:hypothetical protein
MYYKRVNSTGGTQVLENQWETKTELFIALQRSGSIAFVTTWLLFDDRYFYYDGIGFYWQGTTCAGSRNDRILVERR